MTIYLVFEVGEYLKELKFLDLFYDLEQAEEYAAHSAYSRIIIEGRRHI